MAKKKVQDRKSPDPCRLHPYGGYDDASYHLLHALYFSEQASVNAVDHAK